jgi:hypothetical protein
MNALLSDVCCARLPAASLASLAPLRVRAGVRVLLQGDRAWVFWDAPDEEVLYGVLAVAGVGLFARCGEHWFSPGRHLPAFGVPSPHEGQPLRNVLTPVPVGPEEVPDDAITPVTLTLVRDSRPRPASAIICSLAQLARWTDGATSRQLAALKAARLDNRVLVLGERLPALAGGSRYWGRTILVPLGQCPRPDLAEAVLREVLGLQEDDIALVGEDGAEVVSGKAFGQLSRARIRLALRELPA